jgi:CheY-like chemotaxis protein
VILFGIERLLRRTLREDVDLRFEPCTEPCVVLVDTGQAEQVVMNLAVNAQDAMPNGGMLSIRVESEVLDAATCAGRPGSTPGPHGVLVVSDTGHGMDANTRQRMFEPFFSTKGEQGTGLGLSTVYGIVKQHGGYIWVDSEPDHGTVFRVYLPSTEATAIADEPIQVAAECERGSETILLVEDNDAVRELAQTVLRRDGYTILAAASGHDALELLRRHTGPLDLVLTDVIMSGMDGREVYRQVSQQRPGLRVIYMSGYTDNVIARHGVLEQDEHFLQKPFSITALAAKVREVLER